MHRITPHFCFLLLSLTAIVLPAHSQEGSYPYTEFNVGVSVIGEALREGYTYQPITLLPTTSLWQFGRFSAYAEGQFVYADTPVQTGSAFEAGLNMGIRYQQPLFGPVIMNAAIGSGPHYITLNTESQAEGFIFSDNFEIGFSYLRPDKKWSYNLRGRFRHISNAGFKYPNLGLDNFFIIIGLRQQL